MFGTGGDEINVNCYDKDEQTQEDLKKSGKTLEQALDTFTRRTHGALRGFGKKAVVWQGGSPLELMYLASSHESRHGV
jgi:hexosaminidase